MLIITNYFHFTDNFTDFIETALKNREESIKKEKQLIGQSSYFLCQSGGKWISVGLSPAAGFIPIIQLRSANACIFFNEEEWMKFCESDGYSPNHQIEAATYKNINVIRLKSRGEVIVLSTETYNNLFHLQSLVKTKLSMLNSVEFINFYKSILNSCANLTGDLYENILNLLSVYTNSLNAFYMMEAINLCYNTVHYDFEVLNLDV